MNLYQILYVTQRDPHTTLAAYEGTQASAKAKQKELESMHGRHNVDDYVPIEVPTDKPGLLCWINDNAAIQGSCE